MIVHLENSRLKRGRFRVQSRLRDASRDVNWAAAYRYYTASRKPKTAASPRCLFVFNYERRGEPAKDSVADGAQGSAQPLSAQGSRRRRLLLLPAAFPIPRPGDAGSPPPLYEDALPGRDAARVKLRGPSPSLAQPPAGMRQGHQPSASGRAFPSANGDRAAGGRGTRETGKAGAPGSGRGGRRADRLPRKRGSAQGAALGERAARGRGRQRGCSYPAQWPPALTLPHPLPPSLPPFPSPFPPATPPFPPSPSSGLPHSPRRSRTQAPRRARPARTCSVTSSGLQWGRRRRRSCRAPWRQPGPSRSLTVMSSLGTSGEPGGTWM